MNKKYYFIGTCVDLFDEDGDCLVSQFEDVSDFAYQEEKASIISEKEFKDLVSSCSMLPVGNYDYMITQDKEMLFAYEKNKDVHYIFGV